VLLMTLQKLRAGAVRELDKLAPSFLGTCRQTVIDGTAQRRPARTPPRHFLAHLRHASEDSDTRSIPAAWSPACSTLPERERSVLVMTFYDDRPADEVGAALGLTPGNVRVIRHRGIERLRRCVEEQTS
jgi:RNA polymerase sigma-70 factor (ECF subfamily)